MDIWLWVTNLQRELRSSGQFRLADLIDRIPDDAYNGRSDQVLAALPEALAAARALKNPWLEIFFRHHGLNNRLNNLAEGEVALPEAVSLIEFAHRESHAECPQAVCVTQDIARCYGNFDGPGWATDILSVCDETLARITPKWPCFACISQEYGQALLHAGRAAEAVTFLERQGEVILRQGDSLGSGFQVLQVEALRKAGEFERALSLLDEVDRVEAAEGEIDPILKRHRDIVRANIHLGLGRLDQAAECLPAWTDIEPQAYAAWALASGALAKVAPDRNTWELGRELQLCLAYLGRVGAHHDTVSVALCHGELALARGAVATANRALGVARASLPKLREPARLAVRISALEAELEGSSARAELPVPAVDVLRYVRQVEHVQPERDVEWLLKACAECPDDAELAEFTAQALTACGLEDAARDHLWQFCVTHPNETELVERWTSGLLQEQRYELIEALVQRLESVDRQTARGIRARVACQQKQWALAVEHLAAYVDNAPESLPARRSWAYAALQAGQLELALRLRAEVVALQAGAVPAKDLWEWLAAASACQDWPTVRQCSAMLELDLESTEGPVEEDWGYVVLRYDEGGRVYSVYGHRTGPLTARVLSPTYPPWLQRLGDWVVMDPDAPDGHSDDMDDGQEAPPTFRVLHTLESGGFGSSCFVEGAHPGLHALGVFSRAVQSLGWNLWVSSGNDEQVTDPRTSSPIRGLHFSLTAPRPVTAQEVDRVLRSLTASWPHAMCWLRYAELAGLPIEAHREVAQRYRL